MLRMLNRRDFKIVYMGTPSMSAQILEHMVKEGFNIVALIAQEDKPVGRKNIIVDVPTKVVAKQYNIPVYQPHKVREDYEFVKELKPDLILTMAYGQIVPQGLLDIPRLGALNIHGSILPKYRGAAPIQRAIIEGETETGVTLMEMIDKMDAGKMFAIEKCEITPEDNYTSLCDKIVECGCKVIDKNLDAYLEGKLPGVEQDESLVTIAKKIKPEDEKLDLSKPTKEIINMIRGLSYEPGGYFLVDEKKLKVFKAHQIDETKEFEIGHLKIKKGVFLQTLDGVISLDEVQLEGKNKMDGKSFANGCQQLNDKIIK